MTCKICGGRCMPLGVLGNLKYFLCRNCGMQWSKRRKKKRDY